VDSGRRRVGERDYSQRDVLDKLGVKPGQSVALATIFLDEPLRARLLERLGRSLAAPDEPLDLVVVDVDDSAYPVELLRSWRSRLAPGGGIWVLTRKRGRPGYVDQNELIAAGGPAGLVDNKVCSVSDTLSAMRFVIRRVDRPSRQVVP
jgi:Protein of unknown function (DUF3052)